MAIFEIGSSHTRCSRVPSVWHLTRRSRYSARLSSTEPRPLSTVSMQTAVPRERPEALEALQRHDQGQQVPSDRVAPCPDSTPAGVGMKDS